MIDTHITKSGATILISEMSDEHLFNTLKRIVLQSKQGVLVELEFDEEQDKEFGFDTYYGKKALDLLNYESYAKEMYNRINKREK
jgi:hypothetical protein